MTRSALVSLGLIFTGVLVFCLLTPLISDDYYFGSSSTQPFASIMAGDAVLPFGRETFADIFRRAAQMYSSWDGRFMAYVTFGFFLWLPQPLYALLIAGVFCMTVVLVVRHVIGPASPFPLTALPICLAAAALWWGMPTCGSVYFWRTGLAYALDMLCALLFLLPFRQALEHPDPHTCKPLSPLLTAPWLLLAFCFGLLQYNTPILCLLGGLAALYVLWRRYAVLASAERLRRLLPLLSGLVMLGLGLCLLFSAPGNEQRVLIRESWFLSLTFVDKLCLWLAEQPRVQALLWLPWLLVIWALLTFIRCYGRAFWRHIPPQGAALLVLGQMGQGAYLFAPLPDSRAYTSVFLFMLLGAGILARAALASAAPQHARRARCLAYAFLALVLCTLPHEYALFLSGRAELAARDRLYAVSAGQDVRVAPLQTRGDRFFVPGAYQQDITHDPAFWINQVVARHWQLASVALQLPPDRLFSHPHKGQQLCFRMHGNQLSLDAAPPAPGEKYYIYYYGKPGLVRYLPAWLADSLTRWLQQARPGDLRLSLVPLLYAQARLKNGDTAPVMLWGQYPVANAPLWLVRPGDGPASFDLLPLASVEGD